MSNMALVEFVSQQLDQLKAIDIVQLDVKNLTQVTDYMIICSGNSPRHVKALANNLMQQCKKAGNKPWSSEGEDDGEWVLVDLGDVVVHIMLPSVREFYKLENLWSS